MINIFNKEYLNALLKFVTGNEEERAAAEKILADQDPSFKK